MSKSERIRKSKRPLLILKDNIDHIFYAGDERYKKTIFSCFENVLVMLDNYFYENDLYSCIDMESFVNRIITYDDLFYFATKKTEKDINISAYHTGEAENCRGVIINEECISDTPLFEQILCHEFIHDITLGPIKHVYKENGRRFEYYPADQEIICQHHVEDCLVKRFPATATLNTMPMFMIEGLTDFVAQNVYKCVTNSGYETQIQFVEFLCDIFGKNEILKGFLRGNIPQLTRVLGEEKYEIFMNEIKKYDVLINDDKDPNYEANLKLQFEKIMYYFTNEFLKYLQENVFLYKPSELIRLQDVLIRNQDVVEYSPENENLITKQMGIVLQKFVDKNFVKTEEKQDFSKKYKNCFEILSGLNEESIVFDEISRIFAFKENERSFELFLPEIVVDFTADFPLNEGVCKYFYGFSTVEELNKCDVKNELVLDDKALEINKNLSQKEDCQKTLKIVQDGDLNVLSSCENYGNEISEKDKDSQLIFSSCLKIVLEQGVYKLFYQDLYGVTENLELKANPYNSHEIKVKNVKSGEVYKIDFDEIIETKQLELLELEKDIQNLDLMVYNKNKVVRADFFNKIHKQSFYKSLVGEREFCLCKQRKFMEKIK